MSSSALGIITGVVAIAAAIPTDGASLTLLQGVAMAGGAMSIVGAATNNQTLTQMGEVAGLAGAAGSVITDPNSFLNATTGTVNVNPATTDAAVAQSQTAGTDALNALNAQQTADNPLAAANAQSQTAGVNADANPAGANLTAEQLSTNPGQQINNTLNATGASNAATPGNAAATPGEAPTTAPTTPVKPPTPDSGLLAWAQKNQQLAAAAVKIGGGILGGAMNYLAPSPIQKAQIAQANAQTALLQQQYGQRAALNASINGVGNTGWNTNGVSPGSAGVAPPGAPPVASAQGFLAANMGGSAQPPAPTGNPMLSAI